MTQTNQNNDYSWLSEITNHIGGRNCGNPYCEAKILEPSEAEAAIIAKIDKHYIGKGEAKKAFEHGQRVGQYQAADRLYHHVTLMWTFKSDTDPKLALPERANDMLKDCEKYLNHNRRNYSVYVNKLIRKEDAKVIPPKLYLESEVEQRCIEARLKLVEGAYIDQDVIYFRFPGGFADEYTMRQRLRDQLSTNNKDTKQ